MCRDCNLCSVEMEGYVTMRLRNWLRYEPEDWKIFVLFERGKVVLCCL